MRDALAAARAASGPPSRLRARRAVADRVFRPCAQPLPTAQAAFAQAWNTVTIYSRKLSSELALFAEFGVPGRAFEQR